MRFSLLTNSLNPNHGYGVVAAKIKESLEALGHEVTLADPAALVEIAFCQPSEWSWSSEDSYKIGYTPWESTRFPASWTTEMFESADEVWTTSPWCKTVFEKNGLRNVRVYQHGVDAFAWRRSWRRPGRKIKFLHVGEPAPRKGGQLVFDTFSEVFGDRDDVHLTIKSHDQHNIGGIDNFCIDREGYLRINPTAKLPENVTLITDEYDNDALVKLYHDHDVLVYPSFGEGFGLIPLQAMVSGLPVICPPGWAPYADLLAGSLSLPARLVPSPWPDVHPGNMYRPSAEHLAEMMELCADRAMYHWLAAGAYARSFEVEARHDWLTLTRDAFNHIFEMFQTI
jgi:glycosyltransferase involved in cell wall biosynthesis